MYGPIECINLVRLLYLLLFQISMNKTLERRHLVIWGSASLSDEQCRLGSTNQGNSIWNSIQMSLLWRKMWKATLQNIKSKVRQRALRNTRVRGTFFLPQGEKMPPVKPHLHLLKWRLSFLIFKKFLVRYMYWSWTFGKMWWALPF